jgi:hypothetical protein
MAGASPRTPIWGGKHSRRAFPLQQIERLAGWIWNHRTVTFILLWSPYFVATWIWFKPQLPGVAGVLLGGIAAIMAFREMHHTHKLLFTGAILLLIFLEFRDIRLDRQTSDAKALSDIGEQNKKFQAIRNAQDEAFKKTADGLKTAIAGIDSTLQSVSETQEQTRPRALLHYIGGIDIQNPPEPPAGFVPGVRYEIKSDLVNDGNDSATGQKALKRLWVDKPDDQTAQVALVMNFEKEWSKLPSNSDRSVYGVQHRGFQTDFRVFTVEEIERIVRGDTIYLLRRIEYTDKSGTWMAEDCQHLQVAEKHLYIRVSHPCFVFRGDRLPSKRSSQRAP